jgi:hypothetical protein
MSRNQAEDNSLNPSFERNNVFIPKYVLAIVNPITSHEFSSAFIACSWIEEITTFSTLMDRCALLEVLPAEIRLRIYEELFDESYHSSLLIRSDSKIELISLAKAHAAILRTCWTIYREAVPILYDATTFRVQIYPVEGYSSHGNINRLHRSTPFLKQIRHVEIKSCIVLPCHIEPALKLMKTFACALEDSDARIKTLNVRSKLFNDMSKRKLYEYREKLGRRDEVRAADGKCQLFQKMIEGASNSTGFVSVSLDGR